MPAAKLARALALPQVGLESRAAMRVSGEELACSDFLWEGQDERLARRYSLRRVSLDFSECDIEIAENGMSDDEEESVRQALAEEQFLLVELPDALRKIRAKAKGNEKLARKLVFGKLKYTGPEASFSSSHASVMKALDECFHVIVGKAADDIDKTRELLKELKRGL